MRIKPIVLVTTLYLFCFPFFVYPSIPSDPLRTHQESDSVCRPDGFPALSYAESQVFPKDGGLRHPEDGRALPDGRIVVGDEEFGLRIIEKDGSSRGFGKFKEAGWIHDPPQVTAGPNGIFLEKDGRHLLLADVYLGKIYRIDTRTEEVRMIYSHPFGINSLIRDSKGTIWFTQSAKNPKERGFQDLFAAVDRPFVSGAVFYLKGSGYDVESKAVEAASNIYFANGIALDRDEKILYVAETMMGRVLRFDIDVSKQTLKGRETYHHVITPDNLAFDKAGNLWVASPVSNRIYAIDSKCGSLHTVFSAPSESNAEAHDRWIEHSNLGKPLLAIFNPELWKPLPGGLTGMFWSQDHKTLYVTGLGNAILKVETGAQATDNNVAHTSRVQSEPGARATGINETHASRVH
ncbi:MAG: hypothetical protein DWQ47_00800 [Acidobacteria bacterium]|nr:MAG: hypothetical protein DWQ32_11260 [Acidobacteriota bacterium]REK04044.1 MAG: hypothetical protein DWQ38_00785 [Acidobacteriota bacterium]REK15206.1 MAG: hypothetical protein DWQ43_16950 [Acidobacteriota bacterium]REK46296.1 MAG: hypothetical protein DWQ47_00800 [Acidobacteriota bacterium]